MRALILLLFLLSTFDLYGQEEIYLSSLKEKELLSTLYGTTSYSPTTGGKWKPDTEARVNIQVSDDGFCYTEIDTIVYWNTVYGETSLRQAVVIFATNTYLDGERAECHACAPDLGIAVLQKEEGGWLLQKFHKKLIRMGEYGVGGDIAVVKLSSENAALVLSTSYTNQGFTIAPSFWYDLTSWDNVSEIFSVVTFESGPCWNGDEIDWERSEVTERQVELVPNTDPEGDYAHYADLLLTAHSQTCEEEELTTTTRFRYNGFRYEQVFE